MYSIKALESKDKVAWDKFYRAFTPWFRLIAVRRCYFVFDLIHIDPETEIQDVVQEIWAVVWKCFQTHSVKQKEGKALTNFKTVAQNVCTDYLRWQLPKESPAGCPFSDPVEWEKNVRRLQKEAGYVTGQLAHLVELETPEKLLEAKDIQTQLDRVFATMSEEDRTLFELRIWEGTPYKQLAQCFNEPIHVLKMRMYRIKRKLKHELNLEIDL